MSPAEGLVNHAILRVSSHRCSLPIQWLAVVFGQCDMYVFASPGGTMRPARFQIEGLHGHVVQRINSYSVPVDMMLFKVIALFVLYNWPRKVMWLSELSPVAEPPGAR